MSLTVAETAKKLHLPVAVVEKLVAKKVLRANPASGLIPDNEVTSFVSSGLRLASVKKCREECAAEAQQADANDAAKVTRRQNLVRLIRRANSEHDSRKIKELCDELLTLEGTSTPTPEVQVDQ